MSGYAMEWAFRAARDKQLSPTATLVLLALAYNANRRHGGSWAGRDFLAEQTGLGERTVQRAIGHIEKADLVPRERRTGWAIFWQFPPTPRREGRQEGSHSGSPGGDRCDQKGSHSDSLTPREQEETTRDAYRSPNPTVAALANRAMARYSQAEIQLTMEV